MSNISSFNVVYDSDSDVLYVVRRQEAATRGIEDRHGIVWRYGSDGALIGATIMDFYDRWFEDQDTLAKALSNRFDVPAPQAQVVLDHAFSQHVAR